MKSIYFIALLYLNIATIFAQKTVKYVYDYDASGNRIKREIIITEITENTDSISNLFPALKQNKNFETLNNSTDDVKIINVFPNPTFGKVNIITNSSSQNPSDLIIISSTGQILLQEKITNTEYVFDLNNYAVGYYIFKITSAKNSGIWKIVKQN